MLDLHVWGPAFGLPSIDAECLAAIAYLDHAAPSSSWRLVPSSDPSVCPSRTLPASLPCGAARLTRQGHLPALSHDGNWTSGYRQIIDYITSKSLCRDLDAGLDATQKADIVAYSAYLAAHAAPLLDLSLYVSAANWSAATRPAYSALLPFPLTWTVPPLIRAEAVKRAEHLGLAELDTDFDPNAGLHLSAGRDAPPETFRCHLPATTKKTIREEMTPEQAAAIRLHALVGDCLSDVGAFMTDHDKQDDRDPPRFFATSPVSSLDCLAYGYLALMLKPYVPRSFLGDWMQTEHPRLSTFVDSMAPHKLPCVVSKPPSVLTSSLRVVDSILRNAPSLGEHYAKEMRLRAEQASHGSNRRALVLVSSLVTTGAVVAYGLYNYQSLQPFGARSQIWRATRGRSMLSQFGELGTMLSGAMGVYQSAPVPSVSAAETLSAGDGQLTELDAELD